MDAEIKEKLEKGWIRCWSMIEVMAVGKDVTEEALKEHVKKIKKEKWIKIYKEKFEPAVETGNKIKDKDVYTQVVELEFIVKGFKELVDFVILYGPSALEVLEPEKIEIKMGEAQETLNRIATVLHNLTTARLKEILLPK
ncbi:MAG: hypothetical protein J7L45_03195 [Candidatus Aenigmarchaeota archaeon]|nr:hypothetical protein [Candidatus Aenigmarchaeota archaeon]